MAVNLTTSQRVSIFTANYTTADIFLLQMDPSNTINFQDDDEIAAYVEDNELWDLVEDDELAIMLHTDLDLDEVELDNYVVATDAEADVLAEAEAGYYLDDVILQEIPSGLQRYFDGDAWIADYLSSSSRGEILSSYDGVEYDVTLPSGEVLYVYKN